MPCFWVFSFIHDIKNAFRLGFSLPQAVKNFKTQPILQNIAQSWHQQIPVRTCTCELTSSETSCTIH